MNYMMLTVLLTGIIGIHAIKGNDRILVEGWDSPYSFIEIDENIKNHCINCKATHSPFVRASEWSAYTNLTCECDDPGKGNNARTVRELRLYDKKRFWEGVCTGYKAKGVHKKDIFGADYWTLECGE
ncbi:hypothetical protein KJZ61_02950 [Candidatus Dependentiae bacterium]|nr:hypothetical protein [Candidatus Dependentiae bacterium]